MDDERLWHRSDAQWVQIEGTFPSRRGTSGFERKSGNRLALIDSTLVRAHQHAVGAREKRAATKPADVAAVA